MLQAITCILGQRTAFVHPSTTKSWVPSRSWNTTRCRKLHLQFSMLSERAARDAMSIIRKARRLRTSLSPARNQALKSILKSSSYQRPTLIIKRLKRARKRHPTLNKLSYVNESGYEERKQNLTTSSTTSV